jgi:hypothetical protein
MICCRCLTKVIAMVSHGGIGLACLFEDAEIKGMRPGPSLGEASTHFRNLGGAGPVCRVGESDGPDEATRRVRSRALLARLSERMAEPRPAGEAEFNPAIPAGYTYLGQLIAHDMVMSETSLANARIDPGLLRNHRTEPLLLETVYGGGPEVNPLVYALETFADTPRISLRLGRAMHRNTPDPSGWPLRDIARLDSANPAGTVTTNDATYIGREPRERTALIADPRNDDNFLISQLLVLFHLGHNVLCSRLLSEGGQLPSGDPARLSERSRPRVFRVARKLLARTWRRIIREDYLRRLLHPEVHAAYAAGPAPWTCRFDDPTDRRMPVEFSHGAFRMGHAMVRERYQLNGSPETETHFEAELHELLELTSSGTKLDFPLVSDWLVRWSKFFDFPVGQSSGQGQALPTPQPSRRLRPAVAPAMTPMNVLGDGYGSGLPYRDLVSAVEIGVRSAASLAADIGEVFGTPAREAMGGGRGHGLEREIATWLANGQTHFEAHEIRAIAEDPPLPFFVLFEAEHRAEGVHLGYLGSVVVAETISNALARTEGYLADDPLADTWEARTGLSEVDDLPGLCLFILENRGHAEPHGLDIVPLV